jgi:uncharacterized membrane protein
MTSSFIAQVINNSELTKLPEVAANKSSLDSFLGVLFGVIAAIAVLIIVLQGIRFVLSSGDSQKAADARKGIIYALVGLAVSLAAEAITQIVIGRL